MTKKLKKKINWDRWFMAIPIVLSIIGFSKSCITEKKLNDTNTQLSSITFRPLLTLSNLRIDSIMFFSDKDIIKYDDHNITTVNIDSIYLKIRTKIKVTNKGNSTAKILRCLISDTITDNDFLNRVFLKHESSFSIVNVSNIFKNSYQEILPSDSIDINCEFTPQTIFDGKCILHVLLLYENDLGNYYNSYYWARFEIRPFEVSEIEFVKKISKGWEFIIQEPHKKISLINENNVTSVLSKNMQKKMKEYISKDLKE